MNSTIGDQLGFSSEQRRIAERNEAHQQWDLWGSYLSDRQWGTVREDYSADGNAWNSFPHQQARSRAYRWGEDGLLGISDEHGRLCFGIALWNGQDPILKERPFGLGNGEGNHGEDLKDYFYHLLNSPTHSFMRGLYKYPQAEFPYQQLIEENSRRTREDPEYELIDTGIFAENRYFDVFVDYAKASPTDILIRIKIINRGPDSAPLTVLPSLWLRNQWSWGYREEWRQKKQIKLCGNSISTDDIHELGAYQLSCNLPGEWIFTENETNTELLFNQPNAQPYVKDAFHRYVVDSDLSAVNPANVGSKASLVLSKQLNSGEEWVINLRLSNQALTEPFSSSFNSTFELREKECIEYLNHAAEGLKADDAHIFKAAASGLLWCKKFYHWSVARWLSGDPNQPAPPESRKHTENAYWSRLFADDVISMPDSWEYPYFCQWDLMFHSVAFAVIDPAIAKKQCMLLRSPNYTAPNAQTPAYEWALSDPNPPIGAWAALRIFQIERREREHGDFVFLRSAMRKLLLEYGWWANRNDRSGDNVFEGGFLGLDNIAVFDRRFPLADGSRIEQCDGTAWMAMLSLNLLQIAVELSVQEPEYEDISKRFVFDFAQLAITLNTPSISGRSYVNWDEKDGFYYDVIKRPDGSWTYLKTRSVSGLIPLLAVASFDIATVERLPCLDVLQSFEWHFSECTCTTWLSENLGTWHQDRTLFSLVPEANLRRICWYLFNEDEFLSPYGIRSLSKVYEKSPYTFREGDQEQTLAYSPADSPVAMFGGNSNWRGPVWMPINYLLIEALQKFGHYYGDSFMVEFPTGSGNFITLWDASLELEKRLASIFRRNDKNERPFNGGNSLFQHDPYWRDLILFNEYFHGDNGSGVGASHQTGWTAIVLKMITQLNRYNPM